WLTEASDTPAMRQVPCEQNGPHIICVCLKGQMHILDKSNGSEKAVKFTSSHFQTQLLCCGTSSVLLLLEFLQASLL
ncbi:hypothetical protein CRM22_006680, partial [Opisthorchis felineus]